MFGMIEEVYITYLINFSKSARLSTFFVSRKKNRDYHFPVSSIVFAISICLSLGGSMPSKG